MKLFFRIAAIYVTVSLAVTASMRDLTADLIVETGIATATFATLMFHMAKNLIPVFAIVPFLIGWRAFVSNIHMVGYAIFGSILLHLGFSFLKSTIPMIVPFYADSWFADLDKWLHGGVDPWVATHRFADHFGLPVIELVPVYLGVWSIPATALVLIIALTDRNPERTARFVTLYLACWLILGNVFALAGSSVGPVFHDALLGGNRFAGLHATLAASGVADGAIGRIQGYLWAAYAERNMALGSGISAFPSVHVGIATVTALYLAERSRWLIAPGVAFLAIILFLSVYTGYHYAVDGYFSLLFIAGLWWALRRWPVCRMSPRAMIWRPAPPACAASLVRSALTVRRRDPTVTRPAAVAPSA